MKSLLLLVLSLSVFASPGDWAKYDVVYNMVDGSQRYGEAIDEHLSLNGNGTITVRSRMYLEGQLVIDDTYESNTEDTMDSTSGEIVASLCEVAEIGTQENVTVTAGNFFSCKIDILDSNDEVAGNIWVGKVPLGILKLHLDVNDQGIESIVRLFREGHE